MATFRSLEQLETDIQSTTEQLETARNDWRQVIADIDALKVLLEQRRQHKDALAEKLGELNIEKQEVKNLEREVALREKQKKLREKIEKLNSKREQKKVPEEVLAA